jgi:hypothetical protein
VSSSDLTPFGEAGGLRPPDTDESTAAHTHGSPKVSPELALVDPALSSTEGDLDTEVTMSSNAPSTGTFFVDQQPAAPPAPAPVAPAQPEAESAAAPVRGAMVDVPLGTLIFRAGLLAEEQLEDALQEGMRTGKRLGEVLTERGLIQEPDLGRLLAGQRGLQFIELGSVQVDPAAVQLLPEEIARMQNALAIGFEQGVPVVVVADPTNELVVENVRRALGSDPQLVVAAQGDIGRKIDEAYAAPAPAAAPVEPAPVAEDSPVVEPAPVAAPEAPAPALVAQPAPEPQAPPAQPVAMPTPMPTVVPPPEERAPEAQPLVVAAPAPVPAEVPPLVAQPAPEPTQPVAPPVPEPVAAPTPEPVASPTPEPVASPTPEPVASPAPEPMSTPEAAPVDQPAETGLFTQAAEQAIAPLAVDPPSVTPSEEAQVSAPQPEQAPVPAETSEPAPTPTHFVVLRLNGSEPVEIGGFASEEQAESFARTVVGRISRAEEQAEWPFFAGRFLRPQTIVSVDVVEEPVSSWTGSAMRSRWDSQPSAPSA